MIIFDKPKILPTKEDLLWDEKFRDDFEIGESVSCLKKINPLTKFGIYVSEFEDLTPADCVFLQLCRSNCDLLIVSIPTDYSIRLNNKVSKFPTQERIFRLGSLTSVDYIVAYDEKDCSLSIDKISPDFIFYGRTANDQSKYDCLIKKEKLTLIEYPWREERKEGKFFQL